MTNTNFSDSSNVSIQYPRVGIGVVVFNEHEEILLGKRKGAHGEGTWAPAGGHLEFGEDLLSCAQRELYEETGLRAHNLSMLTLTNDIFLVEQKHYITIFLQAWYVVLCQLLKNLKNANCGCGFLWMRSRLTYF